METAIDIFLSQRSRLPHKPDRAAGGLYHLVPLSDQAGRLSTGEVDRQEGGYPGEGLYSMGIHLIWRRPSFHRSFLVY